jgi:hypothetical protein
MNTAIGILTAAMLVFGPPAQAPSSHTGGDPRAFMRVDTWWDPARQNAYMHQVCSAASTALQLDECQYVAESHIDNLRDCIRRRSPYASTCVRLLPDAENELAQVNADPVLQEHREDQREGQRRASIRAACAAQNGGYFAGLYIPCVQQQGVEP